MHKSLTTWNLINILVNAQHGFRKSRSCETALLRLTKILFQARKRKQWSCLVAIDFSKAFDLLDFNLILDAASCCHFGDLGLKWLHSYLTGRTQQVKYGGSLSDPLPITHGVPQGSVLGPTLFLIYFNDLLKTLPPDNVIAYADDVSLVCHGNSSSEANVNMQYLLNNLSVWADNYRLIVNPSKCQAMSISPSVKNNCTPPPTLHLSTSTISTPSSVKILGVNITCDLTWDLHSAEVRRKVNNMISVIHRLSPSLNTDTRRKIYSAFVAPRIDFCLPVWGNSSCSAVTGFNRTLQRAACIIFNSPSTSMDLPSVTAAGIHPFRHLVFIRNVSSIFKMLSNSQCTDYLDALPISLPSNTRVTRGTDGKKFRVPQHTRTCDEKCFQYRAVVDWNLLPSSTTALSSSTSFFKSVHSYLSSHKL